MVKSAVVILNWNGLTWLQKFLRKVVMFTTGQETVIYVADNGSTDGSAEWVNENFSDVRIIRMGKNNGFAGGYNLALEQIDAKYYILLNPDVEVSENWLIPMIRYMDFNPDVAACQPKIKSYYNKDHFEYAGAGGGFIDKFGYTFCRGRIFDRVEKDEGQYDDYADIFWASGACMVIRSDAWQKCNGFDPDFFAHMEEIDLCWRFHGAGFRVSYIPESVVYHIGGGILPYDSELKTYLNFRNNLFLLYKNLPDSKLKSTIFIRKLLDGAAVAMFFLKGRFSSVKAILKAHTDYNKSIDSLKGRREKINRSGVDDYTKLILNKSIVFGFYIKGKKTYKALISK
jgi:GT2 family glycosyltransferase